MPSRIKTGRLDGRRGRQVTASVVPLFSREHVAQIFRRASALDRGSDTRADAERLYREVTRLDPSHWLAWNNIGVLAYRRGDKAEALDAWGQALRANPSAAETHNNVGSLLQLEGKLSVARVYLDNAVRYDPCMLEARINYALALQGLGELSRAAEQWRAALELGPSEDEASYAARQLALCERGRPLARSRRPRRATRASV